MRVDLHGPGLPPLWDPQCRPPHHLLCRLGHTTLDDGLELHVVVDVGVGVGGLHRLQTGLVHWGRGPRVCRVMVNFGKQITTTNKCLGTFLSSPERLHFHSHSVSQAHH